MNLRIKDNQIQHEDVVNELVQQICNHNYNKITNSQTSDMRRLFIYAVHEREIHG